VGAGGGAWGGGAGQGVGQQGVGQTRTHQGVGQTRPQAPSPYAPHVFVYMQDDTPTELLPDISVLPNMSEA
jgi:hypothetical protein